MTTTGRTVYTNENCFWQKEKLKIEIYRQAYISMVWKFWWKKGFSMGMAWLHCKVGPSLKLNDLIWALIYCDKMKKNLCNILCFGATTNRNFVSTTKQSKIGERQRKMNLKERESVCVCERDSVSGYEREKERER